MNRIEQADIVSRRAIKRAVNASWTGELFAQRTGISQEKLQQLELEDRIFYFRVGDSSFYPRWQVKNGHVIKGTERLVRAIYDAGVTPLGSVEWMMGKNLILKKKRPSKYVKKGKIKKVLGAIEAYDYGYYV